MIILFRDCANLYKLIGVNRFLLFTGFSLPTNRFFFLFFFDEICINCPDKRNCNLQGYIIEVAHRTEVYEPQLHRGWFPRKFSRIFKLLHCKYEKGYVLFLNK